MFGIGWTNTYQRWLDPGSSSVVFYSGAGSAFTFAAQGSSYTSPAGLNLTLTKTAQGGYTVQTAHGSQMSFNSSGQLTGIADPNGNTQSLTYNAQGRPATVSDAIGNSITFTYDGNNHVLQAQDSSGRKVTYTYDSNGNLTSSTDPEGAITSYAYYASSAGGIPPDDYVRRWRHDQLSVRRQPGVSGDGPGWSADSFAYQSGNRRRCRMNSETRRLSPSTPRATSPRGSTRTAAPRRIPGTRIQDSFEHGPRRQRDGVHL